MAGFSPDQRPYEFWAKTATQDLTDPDHVDLKTLRAKVLMEDQSTVTLDARTGCYDSKQQLLDLHKDIFLQSSTGYEARLTQAFVDMGKGTVTSDEHVDVKLLNGTLTADKLRITGQRRSGAVRRQCRDESDHGSAPDSASGQSPSRAAPEPAAAVPPRRGRYPASPPTRNDFHDDVFPAQQPGSAIAPCARGGRACAGADRGRRSPRAKHGAGRAQCDAGLFAKPRPADPDRGRLARDARQEKGSDLLRQCEGGAGRHHHDVEDAGGVLRFRRPPPRRHAGGQCEGRRQGRADAVGDARARRQFVDQAARGQGQCRRDPERPGRDRRDRGVRHQEPI